MGAQRRQLYLRCLKLMPLQRIARGTGRAYRTLQAYRRGELEPTPEAVRELAEYLRREAKAFQKAAAALGRALRGTETRKRRRAQ